MCGGTVCARMQGGSWNMSKSHTHTHKIQEHRRSFRVPSLVMAKQFVNAVHNLLIRILCVYVSLDQVGLLTVMKNIELKMNRFTRIQTQWDRAAATAWARCTAFKWSDQNWNEKYNLYKYISKTKVKIVYLLSENWSTELKTFRTQRPIVVNADNFQVEFLFSS